MRAEELPSASFSAIPSSGPLTAVDPETEVISDHDRRVSGTIIPRLGYIRTGSMPDLAARARLVPVPGAPRPPGVTISRFFNRPPLPLSDPLKTPTPTSTPGFAGSSRSSLAEPEFDNLFQGISSDIAEAERFLRSINSQEDETADETEDDVEAELTPQGGTEHREESNKNRDGRSRLKGEFFLIGVYGSAF
jgi:hypothetical protein